MTYENLYNILIYLKKEQIEITNELLEVLKKQDNITKEDYEIFRKNIEIVKFYFENCYFKRFYQTYKHIEDIDYYLNLIVIQDTDIKRYQIILACENKEIRKDTEALEIIANQDTGPKQCQIRFACENKKIRKNKEILKLIASQDTWEKQRELRLFCEHKKIINKKSLESMINKDLKKQEEVIYTEIKPSREEINKTLEDISNLKKLSSNLNIDGFLDYYQKEKINDSIVRTRNL